LWHDVGKDIEMMSDLESGAPCIQTLEWLRSTDTSDVFLQSLRQIVDSDGYNVDAETLEWARRQWNDA